MHKINELIKTEKENLDNNVKASIRVGNAMHYPMLIMMNGNNAQNANNVFCKSFKRVWPRDYNNILFVQNLPDEPLSFKSFENNREITIEELQAYLEKIRSIENKDVFSDMKKQCVYNIVDTSMFSTIHEFIAQYNLVKRLKDKTRINDISMAIILLDESSDKYALAAEIKKYIYENKIYDGHIIISNITISNIKMRTEDLLETAASIIILSNNDAITYKDNGSYNARFSCLFDKKEKVFTVAHSIQKRPTEEIIIQIFNKIINIIYDIYIKKPQYLSIEDWKKIAGINNSGQITNLEKVFDKLVISFNANDIACFPYKKVPNINHSIADVKFSDFREYIFESTFKEYIESFYKTNIENNPKLLAELNNYKFDLVNNVSAVQCSELSSDIITRILNYCNYGSASDALNLKDFYINSLKIYIRKNVFLALVKKSLEEMKDNSSKTITDFEKFKEKLQNFIPNSKEYKDLGTLYESLAESYINSIDGEIKIKHFIASGNNEDDFISCLSDILASIVNINKEVFGLSFIDEWVKRSGSDDFTVVKMVRNTFNDEFKNKLFFYTSGSIPEPTLTVYMFHLGDENWENPTPLFKAMTNEIIKNNTQNIHFVNTGYDYKVEALEFFDITERLLFF